MGVRKRSFPNLSKLMKFIKFNLFLIENTQDSVDEEQHFDLVEDLGYQFWINAVDNVIKVL